MTRPRISRPQGPVACALVALVLGAATPTLSAQTVSGRVLDPVSGIPLGAALVELVDATTGRTVDRAITADAGTYILEAPSPGMYVATARRMGHESTRSEAFSLTLGEDRVLDLSAPRAPVVLPDLVSAAPCEPLSALSPAVASVWSAAQADLARAEVTLREQRLEYEIDRYRQLRSADGDLEYETVHLTEWVEHATPFTALDPESVAETGYVLSDGEGGLVWTGLDEEILLSPAFAASHCFGLVGDETRLGVQFAPAAPPALIEVRGTVWIERESARMSSLEFSYVGPDGSDVPSAGGSIGFAYLPTGEVFVETWTVRAPRLSTLIEGQVDVMPQGYEDHDIDYFEAHGRTLQFRRRGIVTR